MVCGYIRDVQQARYRTMMDSFWNVILFNGLVLFMAEGNGLAYESLNLDTVLRYVGNLIPKEVTQWTKIKQKNSILDNVSTVGFWFTVVGRLCVILAGVVLFGTSLNPQDPPSFGNLTVNVYRRFEYAMHVPCVEPVSSSK